MRFLDRSLALLRSIPRRRNPGGGDAECDPLDLPLVQLGPVDALSGYDCLENILVTGATGSGKTSGSGAAILRDGFMGAGHFGGLILAAKPQEFELIQQYARETGREKDLIRFAPDEPHRFNPLAYEYQRLTRGGGNVTNIVALLMQALEAGGRGSNTGGDDSYWRDALTELLTCAVHAASLATGTVRLADVNRIIQTAPQSAADVTPVIVPGSVDENGNPKTRAPDWCLTSDCFAMLHTAGKNAAAMSEAVREDLALTEDYFFKVFPNISERTRGIIVNMFTAMISPMLRSPMRELFCGETNIDPTACERGAIIVLDLPVKLYGPIGAFAQVLWKMSFQKTMEQRDISKSPVPVFLWIDEYHHFVSSYDASFTSTSRAARACSVFLTQSLPALYDALGKDKGGEFKAAALTSNLCTKIWHTSADPKSNQTAAETIGQVYQMRGGGSTSYGKSTNQSGGAAPDVTTSVGENDGTSSSFSEQLGFQVLPQTFTTLRTGGLRNKMLVDGIVFKPGKIWNATGKNFMQVTFKQK